VLGIVDVVGIGGDLGAGRAMSGDPACG
jgi:hypothetical protein